MTGFDLLFWILIALVVFAKPNFVPEDEVWVLTMFGAYSRTLYPKKPIPPFSIRFIEKVATARQDKITKIEAVAAEGATPSSPAESGQVQIIEESGMNEAYQRTKKGIRSTRIFSRIFVVKNTITKDGITIPEVRFQLGNQMKSKENDPEAAYKSTFALTGPIREALKVIANGSVRSIFGKHPLQGPKGILDEPETIKKEITDEIGKGIELWGDGIKWLKMEEIIPPDDVQKLLRAPFTAKQEGEAKVIENRMAGQAAEEKSRGDAAAMVIEAEGKKQKEILEAQSKTEPLREVAKIFGWEEGGSPLDKFRASQAGSDYMTVDDRINAATEMAKGAGTFVFHDGSNGLMEGAVGVIGKVFRKIEANEKKLPSQPTELS